MCNTEDFHTWHKGLVLGYTSKAQVTVQCELNLRGQQLYYVYDRQGLGYGASGNHV